MMKGWMLGLLMVFALSSMGCMQKESDRTQRVSTTHEKGAASEQKKHESGKTETLVAATTVAAETSQPMQAPLTGQLGTTAQMQRGRAAYYHSGFDGRLTANGERYDQHKLTAAHNTYPFGTRLKVTNLTNNKSVQIRINDRSPLCQGRIIDLSRRAAEHIGLIKSGVAEVQLEVLEVGQGKTFHHPGIGTAAYYHSRFDGRLTASGERYNQQALTASHNRYPFGTQVRVTNLANAKSVVVRINDRGPLTPGRVIDVSRRAAQALGFMKDGIAKVKLEVVERGKS